MKRAAPDGAPSHNRRRRYAGSQNHCSNIADRSAPQLAPPDVGELLPGARRAARRHAREPGLPGTLADRLAPPPGDGTAPAVERVGAGQADIAAARVRDHVQVAILRDRGPHQDRTGPGRAGPPARTAVPRACGRRSPGRPEPSGRGRRRGTTPAGSSGHRAPRRSGRRADRPSPGRPPARRARPAGSSALQTVVAQSNERRTSASSSSSRPRSIISSIESPP